MKKSLFVALLVAGICAIVILMISDRQIVEETGGNTDVDNPALPAPDPNPPAPEPPAPESPAPEPPKSAPDESKGKDIFLGAKCSSCHSVSTAGITSKNQKSGAPDLVNVTVRHDKAWISDYIRRKQDVGHVHCDKVSAERDGKQHKVAFKGTQEEEAALIEWLDMQKKEETK